ncbi:TlpA family protein disulfide reductase [Kineococcus rubinsiae]|uniref:TlpA family protein disulfide reductase n=1 Tax=Kineococcus rubinsiae TaxID=2609562 RepID=UPI00143131FD|nr:hypothetical protein [Kineococcus rubinsiae]NIZ89576.1 hypothetical protein [Kineococcus rubinsiae]
MTALVVGLTVAVALLGVLVAGLLRSHAEILRALHELGAGREDTTPGSAGGPVDLPFEVGRGVLSAAGGGAGVTGTAAPDVVGTTPSGDTVQVSVTAGGGATLVAFLSSGCLTCHGFWERFAASTPELPPATRLVVVTQGPERESASAVQQLAGSDLLVVMSTATWEAYEVPGSPYFVLVDAATGRVAGEGSATGWDQVQRLVGEAAGDLALARTSHAPHDHSRGHSHDRDAGDGPHREARADRELLAAGIAPGHPSLLLTADEVVDLDRRDGSPQPGGHAGAGAPGRD